MTTKQRLIAAAQRFGTAFVSGFGIAYAARGGKTPTTVAEWGALVGAAFVFAVDKFVRGWANDVPPAPKV